MKELKGKIIKEIYLNEDKEIMVFKTIDNEVISYQTKNDCCNVVWFETWENLDILSNYKVNRIIEIPMREVDPTRGDSVEEVYGHRLETNKGYALIEYRNNHNGYYGGTIEFTNYKYSDKELKRFRKIFEASNRAHNEDIDDRFELMDI
jgi:hypothetical protein